MLARAPHADAQLTTDHCQLPTALEFDPGAGAALRRFPVDDVRRGDVLDAEAERLEERDLLGRSAARDPTRQHVAELAADVLVGDGTLPLRDQEVARFVEGGLAEV